MKKPLARPCKLKSLLFCTIAVCNSGNTVAATNGDEADTVIVTATRTAQTADQSLAAVTVITREQIERTQPATLVDLLRTQSGIHISRNGGPGMSTSVFMRGTNNKHTLVLIDGVRAASATLGQFAWHTLSPQQIERIEIVRGPRASLYGSDTIGGVIQIFTRSHSQPSVLVGAGSDQSYRIEAGTGGGSNWKYSLSAGRELTGGFPSHEQSSDDNGYNNTHVTARIHGNISDNISLATSINQSDTYVINDTTTGDNINRNRIIHAQLEQQLADNWMHKLSVGKTLDQSRSLSLYYPSNITTRRDSASWQHDLELPNGLFSIGLDAWQDHATKDDSGIIDNKIDNKAAFFEYQFSVLDNDLVLGARRDDHSVFGMEDSWNIAWGRQMGRLRLSAAYGTAFNAPSINDLYWPYSSGVYWGTTYITQGNTALKPETSNTAEIGLGYRLTPGSSIRANLYRSRIKDMINWTTVQTGVNEFTSLPDNTSRATIEGLEIEASHQSGPWSVAANVNFLNAIDDSTRVQLDRRPRRTLNLNITRTSTLGTFHGELMLNSARNDVSGAYQSGGYGLVNLMYERELGPQTTLQMRIDNLFDKSYALARNSTGNYNVEDRGLHLSLRYRPAP